MYRYCDPYELNARLAELEARRELRQQEDPEDMCLDLMYEMELIDRLLMDQGRW